jgi:hypothetical protein
VRSFASTLASENGSQSVNNDSPNKDRGKDGR